ncbi:MAG: UDP-N-acetylmuramoyl-L-alanyl-D-glutamate--2,6-diaminopimelate ligase [Ferrovibrionaceae bacterium]
MSGIDGQVSGDREIAGLTADSREVRPGFLFAALAGARDDGARYIDDALARGAAAILVGGDVAVDENRVAVIRTAEPRAAFARLAARVHPGQPPKVAAVTGTNGKTSVASFAAEIAAQAGLRAGSLGTLGVRGPGVNRDLGHTTPDPVRLHRELADLAGREIDFLAIEASSHGIDQHRLDGIAIQAAGFTNLSRDHLDYHRDMAGYRAAKLGLFTRLVQADGTAVVNADDAESAAFTQAARDRGLTLWTYGRGGDALMMTRLEPVASGLSLGALLFGRHYDFDLPLLGAFQAHNVLCALGLAVACGIDADKAIAALPHLTGVPGRMQKVAEVDGASVIVDYAHTPDALATVLTAIRPHVAGKLVCVFGCGGDRDPGKRPLMGAAVAAHADRAIVTDDNPRSEDPATIRAAALAACPGAIEIGDRAEAIAAGVAGLARGDVLVIAGKGHEQGQVVGSVVRPFDDAQVARAAAASVQAARRA